MMNTDEAPVVLEIDDAEDIEACRRLFGRLYTLEKNIILIFLNSVVN